MPRRRRFHPPSPEFSSPETLASRSAARRAPPQRTAGGNRGRSPVNSELPASTPYSKYGIPTSPPFNSNFRNREICLRPVLPCSKLAAAEHPPRMKDVQVFMLLLTWERDRARPRGRLSPPRLSSHPERTHDRVKRRSSEELATDGRSFRSQIDDSDPLNFAGPKSLAELKSTKESSQERSNKSVTARLSTESGNTVGFQDVGTEAMSVVVKPVHGVEESKATTTKEEGLIGEADTAEVEEGMIVETAEGEEEGLVPEAAEVAPSPAKDATTEMAEEMVVETAEDAEVEDYEQKNEESDYYGVDDEGAEGGEEWGCGCYGGSPEITAVVSRGLAVLLREERRTDGISWEAVLVNRADDAAFSELEQRALVMTLDLKSDPLSLMQSLATLVAHHMGGG